MLQHEKAHVAQQVAMGITAIAPAWSWVCSWAPSKPNCR
jgi:hypothetical protein